MKKEYDFSKAKVHRGPMRKITRVVVEHMGVRLVKPDKTTKARILKKARETDKKGSWIPDSEARSGR